MRFLEKFILGVKICTFLGCFLFVTHRGYKCVQKYLEVPTSTTFENHYAGGHQMPTITLATDNFVVNEDILFSCNLTLDQYKFGHWTGYGNETYCSDAAEMFKESSLSVRDFDIIFSYSMFNGSKIYGNATDIKVSYFGPIVYFTFDVPKNIARNGVRNIRILIDDYNLDFKIIIHQANAKMTDMPKVPDSVLVKGRYEFVATISHQIIHQLDFEGTKCNPSENYSFDDCVIDYIHQKTMETVGCASIYGKLESICNDTERAEKAAYLFLEMYEESSKHSKWCFYPCTYMDITMAYNLKSKDYTQGIIFDLNFKKFVSVTKSYYSYTELEFLAEFGGYVGLFLGLSVFDLSSFFETLIRKIYSV